MRVSVRQSDKFDYPDGGGTSGASYLYLSANYWKGISTITIIIRLLLIQCSKRREGKYNMEMWTDLPFNHFNIFSVFTNSFSWCSVYSYSTVFDKTECNRRRIYAYRYDEYMNANIENHRQSMNSIHMMISFHFWSLSIIEFPLSKIVTMAWDFFSFLFCLHTILKLVSPKIVGWKGWIKIICSKYFSHTRVTSSPQHSYGFFTPSQSPIPDILFVHGLFLRTVPVLN